MSASEPRVAVPPDEFTSGKVYDFICPEDLPSYEEAITGILDKPGQSVTLKQRILRERRDRSRGGYREPPSGDSAAAFSALTYLGGLSLSAHRRDGAT